MKSLGILKQEAIDYAIHVHQSAVLAHIILGVKTGIGTSDSGLCLNDANLTNSLKLNGLFSLARAIYILQK